MGLGSVVLAAFEACGASYTIMLQENRDHDNGYHRGPRVKSVLTSNLQQSGVLKYVGSRDHGDSGSFLRIYHIP